MPFIIRVIFILLIFLDYYALHAMLPYSNNYDLVSQIKCAILESRPIDDLLHKNRAQVSVLMPYEKQELISVANGYLTVLRAKKDKMGDARGLLFRDTRRLICPILYLGIIAYIDDQYLDQDKMLNHLCLQSNVLKILWGVGVAWMFWGFAKHENESDNAFFVKIQCAMQNYHDLCNTLNYVPYQSGNDDDD